MFLNIFSNLAVKVSQVFPKILEISYSNKATMRREIEVLAKNIWEKDVVCTLFPVQLKISRKNRFFKFTLETQPACVS